MHDNYDLTFEMRGVSQGIEQHKWMWMYKNNISGLKSLSEKISSKSLNLESQRNIPVNHFVMKGSEAV